MPTQKKTENPDSPESVNPRIKELRESISALNFEAAMQRLEKLTGELESGSAPLDRSLELFEEGTLLVERCNKLLDSAQSRVKMLTRSGGEYAEEDFTLPAKNEK